MSQKRLILIDGDMVAYRNAVVVEGSAFDFGDGEVGKPSLRSVAMGYKRMDTFIDQIRRQFDGEVLVPLSVPDREQFRVSISPSYKANRANKPRPSCLGLMKDHLRDRWKAFSRPGLEADDLIGIKATSPAAKERGCVIVSIDKDFMQLPAYIYNPHHKDGPQSCLVTPEEADFNWMKQTLVGDTCDGFGGCPGMGPIKSDNLLRPLMGNLEKLWDAVVNAFEAAWLTEEDAITQARLARILRYGEWGPKTGVKLWSPPWPSTLKTPAQSASSAPVQPAIPQPTSSTSRASSAPSS